jgi:homoserine dehydrogenase
VVTANKQLMAHCGIELLDLARAQRRELRFEASVAGGIPVLRALQEGLAGDRLVEVRGILNGTCNFILSRMQAEPVSFADVLAEAQRAGYAEADPTEDVDGADAAAKLAIIAAVGLRRPVRVSEIATRSIRPIEPVDFRRSGKRCTIRQIARAAEDNGAVFAAVRPALVPLGPDSAGRGSQNWSPCAGFWGDVVLRPRCRRIRHRGGGRVGCLVGAARGGRRSAARSGSDGFSCGGDFVAPHYVRFIVNDKPGILAQITNAYARYGINIDGVLQLPKFRKDRLPFVTTLEECSEAELDRALADVAGSDYHVQPPLSLPIFS